MLSIRPSEDRFRATTSSYVRESVEEIYSGHQRHTFPQSSSGNFCHRLWRVSKRHRFARSALCRVSNGVKINLQATRYLPARVWEWRYLCYYRKTGLLMLLERWRVSDSLSYWTTLVSSARLQILVSETLLCERTFMLCYRFINYAAVSRSYSIDIPTIKNAYG